MRGIDRARTFLATLIFCGFAATANAEIRMDLDPEWRQAGSISGLLQVLEAWLDDHAEFERRDDPPVISMISSSMAASLSGMAGRGHGRTRGLYDAPTSTIYLVQPWNPTDAMDVSVLLHELVHHRQAPHYFRCPGAQEEAAYRFQDNWLGERGLRADVNWMAVILEAGCSPRDIHPD